MVGIIERGFEPPIYYAPDGRVGGPGKDRLTPGPNQIEIGASLYTLSEETQRYFFRINLADYGRLWLGAPPESNPYPDYDKQKSVLFVSDPHFNVAGQFRVYKGLETFFRDNPELIKQTTFLAEGFPTGEHISVQSLIKTDPNPSDRLIREVLESHLITGYMAYEWKYKRGIPIIGVEDPPLYALSRDYALLFAEHPNKLFFTGPIKEMDDLLAKEFPPIWQQFQRALHESSARGKTAELEAGVSVTFSDRLVWNLAYGAAFGFICTVRNYDMAQSLIQQSNKYKNPILFAGSSHIQHDYTSSLGFNVMKLLAAKSAPNGPFGKDALPRLVNGKNLGIYHYLKNAKLGFTFLDPEKLGDQPDGRAYYKLFQSQQGADRQNMDYAEYVDWLLKQRGLNQGTTVRPSPEKAAEYVKRLKERTSGVVYERKEEEEEECPYWTKTSQEEVWDAVTKDSIWHQPPRYQGLDFEQIRHANLGSNCPVIDDIVMDAGTATSMKTLDVTSPSYQNVGAIDSRVSGYIDDLSGFTGGDWGDYHFERGVNFQDRYLEIGIPAGRASQEQIDKLQELQDYAQSRDVTLVINEVP